VLSSFKILPLTGVSGTSDNLLGPSGTGLFTFP
jgi:hypothetical protein